MSEIVVVGPCGSGKTTLVAALAAHGYAARAVAQEHSGVPELWRHGGDPLALILLEAEPRTITRRRHADFPVWLYHKQQQRLQSARRHATLLVQTDQASPEEVAARVVAFLHDRGMG